MSTDRPAVDREALIDWVRNFLYQFDLDGYEPGGTGMPNEEAAKIIVEEICAAHNRLLSGEPIERILMTNPESFFRNFEGR